MSINQSFNNTFVVPVLPFDKTFGYCLEHFRIVAKHIPRVVGNLMANADEYKDDPQFVAGAKKFLDDWAKSDLDEVIDFAEDGILNVDHGSAYSVMLTEMLLTSAEQRFLEHELVDEDERNDYDYHGEAIEIVKKVIPFTDLTHSFEDTPTLNRAVDLLLKFAQKTSNQAHKIFSTSEAMKATEDDDRKAIIANTVCNKCRNLVDTNPFYALKYLGGAIDKLDQDNPHMESHITTWTRCLDAIDPEEALEQALSEQRNTENPAFLDRIEEVVATLEAMPKPVARPEVRVPVLQLVAN